MGMIERAAKALDDVYDISPRGELINHEACIRAVLAAIREPSEGMKDAGSEAMLEHGVDIFLDSRETVAMWQAMIDAALGETP